MSQKSLAIFFSFLLFLVLINKTGSSLEKTDSLFNALSKAKGNDQVSILLEIAETYIPISLDSSLHYAGQALELPSLNKTPEKKAKAYLILGIVYRKKSSLNLSLEFLHKSLALTDSSSTNPFHGKLYNNIGLVYRRKGNYGRCVHYLHKSLDSFEKLGDKPGISKALNNLGVAHEELLDLTKALDYYEESLGYNEQLNFDKGIAASYNNIGNVYFLWEQFDQALSFFNKSLQIKQAINDSLGTSSSLNNIGNVYLVMEEFGKALSHFQHSLEIEEQIMNQPGIINSLQNLGTAHFRQESHGVAESYYLKSLEIAKEHDLALHIKQAHKLLSSLYYGQKKFELALEHYVAFNQKENEIFNLEHLESIANLESTYEIGQQEKELMLQQEKMGKQQITIYGLIGGAFLLILLVVLTYNQFRLKNKANRALEKRNKEINNQKEEIQTQRDQIFTQNKEIMDSIIYASLIQNAILPPQNLFTENFKEHFILFKPRDVVSGDYYWINKTGDLIVVAAADCTGHGVPGGFLSMLGISFLNEILSAQKAPATNRILDKLCIKFIDALHQTNRDYSAQDGMDIALCIIDKGKNKIQFSGANNPLYIIRNKELIQLKPNRYGIGNSHNQTNCFTANEFDIHKNDALYLFTDGYVDQFGGERGKKIKSKKFREMLTQISPLPMTEQKTYLDNYYLNWQGSNFQVDDVLIIGLRI